MGLPHIISPNAFHTFHRDRPVYIDSFDHYHIHISPKSMHVLATPASLLLREPCDLSIVLEPLLSFGKLPDFLPSCQVPWVPMPLIIIPNQDLSLPPIPQSLVNCEDECGARCGSADGDAATPVHSLDTLLLP